MLVIIMSGIPGSGKTAYASGLLASTQGSVLCSADLFFEDRDGVYRFDSARLPEAHRACWLTFERAIRDGAPLVIVDNTNTRAVEIAPYVLPAEAHGYDVEIVRVACDPGVAWARQRHGVPDPVFSRMALDFSRRDVLPRWHVRDISPL